MNEESKLLDGLDMIDEEDEFPTDIEIKDSSKDSKDNKSHQTESFESLLLD